MVPNKIDKVIDKKKPAIGVDRRHPIKDIKLTDDISIPCLRAVLEAYFAAEAVRHASRDSFLDEEDPFEDLLDESFDGVVEVWDRKYENGLERLNSVLSQAVRINMESNLISRETAWVTVRVKKGLCHILVNEGRIEGWVYDESI